MSTPSEQRDRFQYLFAGSNIGPGITREWLPLLGIGCGGLGDQLGDDRQSKSKRSLARRAVPERSPLSGFRRMSCER